MEDYKISNIDEHSRVAIPKVIHVLPAISHMACERSFQYKPDT